MEIDQPVLAMDWFPTGKGSQEVLAIAHADGSFKMVNKTGRVEKAVADAHQTAIISIKWSYDSAALATAGEDGQIKVKSTNFDPRRFGPEAASTALPSSKAPSPFIVPFGVLKTILSFTVARKTFVSCPPCPATSK